MGHNHLPAINISNDFASALFSMGKLQILIDPDDKIVLECALNQLVKKIWGDEFVDVCTREIQSERLVHIPRTENGHLDTM